MADGGKGSVCRLLQEQEQEEEGRMQREERVTEGEKRNDFGFKEGTICIANGGKNGWENGVVGKVGKQTIVRRDGKRKKMQITILYDDEKKKLRTLKKQ